MGGFQHGTDISDLTIKAWAAQGTNRSWEQVQYYLIHGSIGLNIGAETQYYWWVNGGTGDSVDFSGIAGYSTAVDILLDAQIFRLCIGVPGRVCSMENIILLLVPSGIGAQCTDGPCKQSLKLIERCELLCLLFVTKPAILTL